MNKTLPSADDPASSQAHSEMLQYIHLKVHSAYSLLEGALPIGKVAKLAEVHKFPAVGLTDTNNLFGTLEFSDKLAGSGVQPIAGISLALEAQGDALALRVIDRRPEPELERLEEAALADAAFALVGDQDHRLSSCADEAGKGAVGAGDTLARIDQEQHAAMLPDRERHPLGHLDREAVGQRARDGRGLDPRQRLDPSPSLTLGMTGASAAMSNLSEVLPMGPVSAHRNSAESSSNLRNLR